MFKLFNFHKCKFEFVAGSMKKNGYVNCDHALNLRPEYDAIERCECGKERIVQFMSYADPPLKSPTGLKARPLKK